MGAPKLNCGPAIILLAETACGMAVFVTGVMMTKIQYHMRPTESLPEPLWDRLNRTASNANTAYWAASFIVNSIMTILIGARIWWQTRGYSDSSIKIEGRKHIRVTLIISPRAHTLFAINGQVVGIFPTAILVLVGLRLAVEKATRKVEGTFSMPVLGTMPTRL